MQKTAYEMRISDWSSDVCSSDLNGGYLHSRIGDFPGAPNSNRLPNGRNDFGDPTFNAKGNRMPNAPKFSGKFGFEYRLPVDGEIGRAPCRERVCQYV